MTISLLAWRIAVLEREAEEMIIYVVKNIGATTICLDDALLKNEGVLSVFLNTRNLRPNEHAICVVSFNNERILC